MAPERSKDKPKNVALEFTTRFLCARSLDFWASVSLDLYIYIYISMSAFSTYLRMLTVRVYMFIDIETLLG